MTTAPFITDLPLGTIDRHRAAIFVAEFLAWWDGAGRWCYGPSSRECDEGLQHFSADAIDIAGGLTLARAIAPGLIPEDQHMHEGAVETLDSPKNTTTNAPPPAKRQMTKTEKDLAELDNIYTYHRPHGDQPRRYEHLRAMAKLLADAVITSCPPSRERALALTNVQQATMWANASIAINEPAPVAAVITDESVTSAVRVERIARATHEANRQYCQSLGDFSQAPWDEAPEWQKTSARAGVQQILDQPNTTPRQSHENWMAQKIADGWVFGDTKDALLKTHPCLVPYEELPIEQRTKDHLFGAIVRSLNDSL